MTPIVWTCLALSVLSAIFSSKPTHAPYVFIGLAILARSIPLFRRTSMTGGD